MITHETRLRVRYAETDQMGYCYYGNYAQYYEVGRVELIRSLGLTYSSMEKEHGILMPVMTLNVRYIRPVLYDEEIRIQTSIQELPQNSITFHSEIYNENGKLANGGKVKLGFIRADDYQRIPAPMYLIKKMEPYFEAPQG